MLKPFLSQQHFSPKHHTASAGVTSSHSSRQHPSILCSPVTITIWPLPVVLVPMQTPWQTCSYAARPAFAAHMPQWALAAHNPTTGPALAPLRTMLDRYWPPQTGNKNCWSGAALTQSSSHHNLDHMFATSKTSLRRQSVDLLLIWRRDYHFTSPVIHFNTSLLM